jgi:hypothetical protein
MDLKEMLSTEPLLTEVNKNNLSAALVECGSVLELRRSV